MPELFCADNFLSEEDLGKLNQAMLARYKRIKSQDQTIVRDPTVPVSNRELIRTDVDMGILLGPVVPKVVQQIKQYVTDEIRLINPQFGSVWYLYITPDKITHMHTDGPITYLNPDASAIHSVYIAILNGKTTGAAN